MFLQDSPNSTFMLWCYTQYLDYEQRGSTFSICIRIKPKIYCYYNCSLKSLIIISLDLIVMEKKRKNCTIRILLYRKSLHNSNKLVIPTLLPFSWVCVHPSPALCPEASGFVLVGEEGCVCVCVCYNELSVSGVLHHL